MMQKPLFITLFLLVALLFGGDASIAATITWKNPVSGNWSKPSNWSPAIVPGPSDDVLINVIGTYEVTLDASAEIASLSIGSGTLSQRFTTTGQVLGIQGSTLISPGGHLVIGSSSVITCTGGVENRGIIGLTDATLNADLENQGRFDIRERSALNGSFKNRSSGQLVIIGSWFGGRDAFVDFDRGFLNEGQILLIGDRSGSSEGITRLTLATGALVNATGASLRVYNEGSHTFNGGLENYGTLLVDRPLTVNTGAYENINSGTIEVRNLGAPNRGELKVNLGTAKGTVGSGTFTHTGALTIDGGRIVRFAGGVLNWKAASAPVGVPTSELLFQSGCSVRLLDDLVNDIRITAENSSINGPWKIVNRASFLVSGSHLNLDFENHGLCDWQRTCSFKGVFQNLPNSQLLIIGSWFGGRDAFIEFDRGFVNQGQILIIGDRSGSAEGITRLTLATGALINATGALLRVYNEGSHTLNGGLENYGTLLIDRPFAVNTGAYENINSGTIEVRNLGAPNRGELKVNLGTAKSTVGSGTLTHTGALTIDGGRIVRFAGGVINWDTASAPVGVPTSELLFQSSCSVRLFQNLVSGIHITVEDSSLMGPGKIVSQASLLVSGSNLNLDLENHGRCDWQRRCSFKGEFENLPGSLFVIVGSWFGGRDAFIEFNRGFVNQGQILIIGDRSGSAEGITRLTLATGALVNATGASLRVYNEGSHTLNGGLENYGTLLIDRPFTVNTGAYENINSGTIEVRNLGAPNRGTFTLNMQGAKGIVTDGTCVNSGTIRTATDRAVIVDRGTFFHQGGSVKGTGLFEIGPNAHFFGTAPIGMNLTNRGEMNPGLPIGKLQINANFTQTAQGRLKIEIGGTSAGKDYDQLIVNGSVNLAGLMNVKLVNGFTPTVLDRFEVLPYQDRHGLFGSINGLTPVKEVVLLTVYGPTSLTLEAESMLDPSGLMDLLQRFVSDQTNVFELIRRSRTWLRN